MYVMYDCPMITKLQCVKYKFGLIFQKKKNNKKKSKNKEQIVSIDLQFETFHRHEVSCGLTILFIGWLSIRKNEHEHWLKRNSNEYQMANQQVDKQQLLTFHSLLGMLNTKCNIISCIYIYLVRLNALYLFRFIMYSNHKIHTHIFFRAKSKKWIIAILRAYATPRYITDN